MLSSRIQAWKNIFAAKGAVRGLHALTNAMCAKITWRFPSLAGLARALPQTFDFEISTVCNLACVGCIHGGMEGARFQREQPRFMTLDQARLALSELGPSAHAVNLTTLGETFLNPEAFEIIRLAKSYGLTVMVDTNGQVLDPQKVLDSGLDEITFAVDGFSQATYESYRRRGNLQKLLRNMEQLQALATQRKSNLKICAKFLVTAFTETEIEAARKYFAQFPNVYFYPSLFKIPAPDWTFFRANLFGATKELHETWAPKQSKQYDAYTFDPKSGLYKLKYLFEEFQDLCEWVNMGLYIHCNGDAYPCCNSAVIEHSEFLLGNIFTDGGVAKVLHGEKAQQLRQRYRDSGGRFSLCGECIVNRVSGQPLREPDKNN